MHYFAQRFDTYIEHIRIRKTRLRVLFYTPTINQGIILWMCFVILLNRQKEFHRMGRQENMHASNLIRVFTW